ncbi:hypothetical protein BD289DRAFT_296033 [Coniella lustricola]|uniref:Uncharacterized protein n=1 Tax=Coniella lustricola TaxID=2025994 RepID=A0A2T3A4U5_9PEZI|nr:hypothetical protein BD289DRAFT_296033 [Coniella lustricola]
MWSEELATVVVKERFGLGRWDLGWQTLAVAQQGRSRGQKKLRRRDSAWAGSARATQLGSCAGVGLAKAGLELGLLFRAMERFCLWQIRAEIPSLQGRSRPPTFCVPGLTGLVVSRLVPLYLLLRTSARASGFQSSDAGREQRKKHPVFKQSPAAS